MTCLAVLVLAMISVATTGAHPADDHVAPSRQSMEAGGHHVNLSMTMHTAPESDCVWTETECTALYEELEAMAGLDLRWVFDFEQQQSVREQSPERTALNASGFSSDDGSGITFGPVLKPDSSSITCMNVATPTAISQESLKNNITRQSRKSKTSRGSSSLSDEVKDFVAQFSNTDHHRVEEIRTFYNHQDASDDPCWRFSFLRRSFGAIIRCYDEHCGGNADVFKARFPTLALKSFYTNGCRGHGTECEYVKYRESKRKREERFWSTVRHDAMKGNEFRRKRAEYIKRYRQKKKSRQN